MSVVNVDMLNFLTLWRSIGLLGRRENGVKDGKNTTVSDSDVTEKFVHFLIITDGWLQVAMIQFLVCYL